MFSCVSRALRGDSRTKKTIQLHTPNDFDNFLRKEVFEGGISVTRIHIIPDMKTLLSNVCNPNTRGLGHQGWRPGHVLARQRVSMLERLSKEAPSKYLEMVQNNSLIVPDATAEFILEDFDVLLAMARGHDGKNPNHWIRFVWDSTANRSVVQYKHFSFEESWRPTLKFCQESGRWIPDADIRYRWLKADVDLGEFFNEQVLPKAVKLDPIPQSTRDNVTMCVTSMANFGSAQLEEWKVYFGFVLGLKQNPIVTLPYVSPKEIAQLAISVGSSTQAAVVQSTQKGALMLTSTVGSHTRETLVAAGETEATAWSNDQADLRLTSRVTREPPSGQLPLLIL